MVELPLSESKSAEVLVLLSGGVDSMAALALHKSQGLQTKAIHFNYGQAASRHERASATRICEHFKVPLDVAECVGLGNFGTGVINGRNGFLLFAGLIAFPKPSGLLCLGVHEGTNYYDCSGEFIAKMQGLFEAYTDGQIRLSTPFLEWTKVEIWEYCKSQHLPIHLTYSCEAGTQEPCGRCNSCRDLKELHAR